MKNRKHYGHDEIVFSVQAQDGDVSVNTRVCPFSTHADSNKQRNRSHGLGGPPLG
jgi:hypothetical protein